MPTKSECAQYCVLLITTGVCNTTKVSVLHCTVGLVAIIFLHIKYTYSLLCFLNNNTVLFDDNIKMYFTVFY